MSIVMKNYYIFIFGCLLLHACKGMEEHNIKDLSPRKDVRPIDEKDLPSLVGEKIKVKISDSAYIVGTLGNKVSDSSPYYKVYYDKECIKGNPYLPKQLYYFQSDDQ